MSKFTIFILIMIGGSLVANEFFTNVINTIWLVFWGLFIVFLMAHSWMDKRGMFNPKKKNEEG